MSAQNVQSDALRYPVLIGPPQSLHVDAFPCVTVLRSRFDLQACRDEADRWCAPPLPDHVRHAVPQRKAAYAAGRALAKILLRRHGALVTDVPVNARHLPVWPPGWLGSISHAADMAICAVAPWSDGALLGVDIESWMPDDTAYAILSLVMNEPELLSLHGWGALAKRVTVAFSAKESAFKALYPQVGRYFDFSAIRIIDCEQKTGRLCLRVEEPLSPELPKGRQLEAWCQADAGHVVTLVAESA